MGSGPRLTGLPGTTVPTSPRTGGHGLYVIREGVWSATCEISLSSWADNFTSLSLKFCPTKWGGMLSPGQPGVRIGDDGGKVQAQSQARGRYLNKRGSGYSPGGRAGREGVMFTAAPSPAWATHPHQPTVTGTCWL